MHRHPSTTPTGSIGVSVIFPPIDIAFTHKQGALLPHLMLTRRALRSLPMARRLALQALLGFVRGLNMVKFPFNVPLSYSIYDFYRDRTFTGKTAPASLGTLFLSLGVGYRL